MVILQCAMIPLHLSTDGPEAVIGRPMCLILHKQFKTFNNINLLQYIESFQGGIQSLWLYCVNLLNKHLKPCSRKRSESWAFRNLHTLLEALQKLHLFLHRLIRNHNGPAYHEWFHSSVVRASALASQKSWVWIRWGLKFFQANICNC